MVTPRGERALGQRRPLPRLGSGDHGFGAFTARRRRLAAFARKLNERCDDESGRGDESQARDDRLLSHFIRRLRTAPIFAR